MKFFLKSAALIIFMGISMIFSSCSDDSNNEELIVKYSYKLNETPSGSSLTYHRVNEYACVDNFDNTFNVKKFKVYFFSTSNNKYKDMQGGELFAIAKAKNLKPDGIYEYTLKKDSTVNVNGSQPIKYYIPAGLTYEVWYYF